MKKNKTKFTFCGSLYNNVSNKYPHWSPKQAGHVTRGQSMGRVAVCIRWQLIRTPARWGVRM